MTTIHANETRETKPRRRTTNRPMHRQGLPCLGSLSRLTTHIGDA